MKLLLTSVSISPLKELTSVPYRDLRLVYIPTAADPYKDKWFIEADRKRFRQMGIRFQELDIKGKTSKELLNALRPAHAVFVSGGNTFYLLEKAKESGFDKAIRKVIDDGVIYIGGSAGAVIAGPTIAPVSRFDDPSAAPTSRRLTDSISSISSFFLTTGRRRTRQRINRSWTSSERRILNFCHCGTIRP